jgi:hypothetical protein
MFHGAVQEARGAAHQLIHEDDEHMIQSRRFEGGFTREPRYCRRKIVHYSTPYAACNTHEGKLQPRKQIVGLYSSMAEDEMATALEVISLLDPVLASIIHQWCIAGLFSGHRTEQISIAGMQLAAVMRSPPSFLSSGRADPVKTISTRAVVGFIVRTPQNSAVSVGDELIDPKQPAAASVHEGVACALLHFRRLTVRALPPAGQDRKTEAEKTAMRKRFVAALESLVQQQIPYPPLLGKRADPKMLAEVRLLPTAECPLYQSYPLYRPPCLHRHAARRTRTKCLTVLSLCAGRSKWPKETQIRMAPAAQVIGSSRFRRSRRSRRSRCSHSRGRPQGARTRSYSFYTRVR